MTTSVRQRRRIRRWMRIRAHLFSFMMGLSLSVALTFCGGAGGGAQETSLLEDRVAALEKLLAAFSIDEAGDLHIDGSLMAGTNVFIDGLNVHIRSGSGYTDDTLGPTGELTGLGNLIIGYDEATVAEPGDPTEDFKTGSHNLVIGSEHTYSSYAGLVAGYDNRITGDFATVTGGFQNTASGNSAAVSGGNNNTASGTGSSVSGGLGNAATSNNASVSGGKSNWAAGSSAAVAGGLSNTANGPYATVLGGDSNVAGDPLSAGATTTGAAAVVAAGRFNVASGDYASVLGGGGTSDTDGNTASGDYAAVSGGRKNTASAEGTAVSGGWTNTASTLYASVSGGSGNNASGMSASVSGGSTNTAAGQGTSVVGGIGCTTVNSTDDFRLTWGGRSGTTCGTGN
ncbi:MAG TPA: hypothetical protein VKB51_06735 [bacterium]|nr:hypothetical protein [bacterium]